VTGISPDKLVTLVEGAAVVTAHSDLAALLRSTVELARETTGARYAALGVIGEHGTLVEFIHVGFEPGLAERIGSLPVGRGVLGTLIHSAKTIRLDRPQDHPDSSGFPPHHPPMSSFLGVPVRSGDRVFGNLYLTEKTSGFTAEDEMLVEALAVIAGSAISNVRTHQRLRRLAVVDDRERIARDLHDAIIQDLFAVGLLLQGMALRSESERERNDLGDAVQRLDEAIASLRTFIFDLRPPAWNVRSLGSDITRLVRQLADPYEANVIVEVGPEVEAEGDPVPGELIDDVIQIVREATSNALRHSKADTVRVSIGRSGGFLHIEVEDSGKGFDVGSAQEGMGLSNIRWRAEKSGGESSIRSRSGEGTTVKVILPT
jgi:signal transduction histidine kinase